MTKKVASKQKGGTFLGFIIGGIVGLLVALGIAVYVNHIPLPFFQHDDTRTLQQDEVEAAKNKDWNPNAFLFGNQNTAVQNQTGGQSASGTVAGSAPVPGATPAAPTASNMASAPLTSTGGAVNSGKPIAEADLPAPASIAVNPASNSSTAPAAPTVSASPTAPAASNAATTTQPTVPVAGSFYVQIGAYQSRDQADAQRANLSLNGVSAKISVVNSSAGSMYRVRLGPYADKAQAQQSQDRLAGMAISSVVVQGS